MPPVFMRRNYGVSNLQNLAECSSNIFDGGYIHYLHTLISEKLDKTKQECFRIELTKLKAYSYFKSDLTQDLCSLIIFLFSQSITDANIKGFLEKYINEIIIGVRNNKASSMSFSFDVLLGYKSFDECKNYLDNTLFVFCRKINLRLFTPRLTMEGKIDLKQIMSSIYNSQEYPISICNESFVHGFGKNGGIAANVIHDVIHWGHLEIFFSHISRSLDVRTQFLMKIRNALNKPQNPKHEILMFIAFRDATLYNDPQFFMTLNVEDFRIAYMEILTRIKDEVIKTYCPDCETVVRNNVTYSTSPHSDKLLLVAQSENGDIAVSDPAQLGFIQNSDCFRYLQNHELHSNKFLRCSLYDVCYLVNTAYPDLEFPKPTKQNIPDSASLQMYIIKLRTRLEQLYTDGMSELANSSHL